MTTRLFFETVALSPPPASVLDTSLTAGLPKGRAVELSPGTGVYELYREHTFRVPRYPAGPFTTVGFNGYVEIREVGEYDERTTNGAVLPAKYSLPAAIQSAVRIAVRDLRKFIRRRRD